MTKCTTEQLEFPALKRRNISTQFSGGDITSDGGCLFLRQSDRKLDLIRRIAAKLHDHRDPHLCRHSTADLIRQRVFGLALGYEDLNDHQQLRLDPALQTAVDRDEELASAPTLCRLENRSRREDAVKMHEVLLDTFVASRKKPPRRLVLDFDATDDVVHGRQQGRFFHGYYDHYCFLPLYVFCDKQLLVSYLRPSKIDGAKHAWAILALLVKRLRRSWPKVKITMRADSGFCRYKMLSWCERNGVDYIIGLAKNKRLVPLAAGFMQQARWQYEESGEKQRVFGELRYAAGSWSRKRRVIAKAEYGPKGANPRFIITNLEGDGQKLYEDLYCARGDMENRIKEQQLDLFADRTSCHKWYANQFRLMLSSLAYVLVDAIRRIALVGTELARAQCGTIRLKLFKIGAVIIRNTRRIRFLLSSAYPYQNLFFKVARRLC